MHLSVVSFSTALQPKAANTLFPSLYFCFLLSNFLFTFVSLHSCRARMWMPHSTLPLMHFTANTWTPFVGWSRYASRSIIFLTQYYYIAYWNILYSLLQKRRYVQDPVTFPPAPPSACAAPGSFGEFFQTLHNVAFIKCCL